MPKCCSPFSEAATNQFGAGVARRDVAKYRRRGPDAPTQLLRDGVLAADSSRATVLDIGGGMGALSLELIAAGVGHATLVDASAPSSFSRARGGHARRWAPSAPRNRRRLRRARRDAAHGRDRRDEPRRLLLSGLRHAILPAALARSARVFAFWSPKDRWYIRAVAEFGNRIRALTGKAFRTFVHKESLMHALIEARGFRRRSPARHVRLADRGVDALNGSMMR